MKLDLSSLRKAIESLEKTIRVANDDAFMSRLEEDQKQAVKAGVIQNFEFTYELCWKFMRRWLEVNLGTVYVAGGEPAAIVQVERRTPIDKRR